MFGHQDNQPTEQSDQATTTNSTQDDTATPLANQAHPAQPDPAPAANTDTPTGPNPPPSDAPAWHHSGKAVDDNKHLKNDVISPAGGFPTALSSKEPVPSLVPSLSPHAHLSINPDDNQLTEATDEDLLDVKQKALDQLFPLIDKLDQTSEEHFKTLMMIIQASDNHTLIEKAYQVAQTIDNEKSRAQALLDIVNEINYFTQQPEI